MGERAAPYRATRQEHAGAVGITPAEARELQKLYDQLPKASLEAADALRSAGSAPTSAAIQHFRKLDAYVDTIIDRIREILSQ